MPSWDHWTVGWQLEEAGWPPGWQPEACARGQWERKVQECTSSCHGGFKVQKGQENVISFSQINTCSRHILWGGGSNLSWCFLNSPKEAVDIFEPLGNEVICDWFSVVWKAEILQCVEEKRWAVIKCSDRYLQAHCPQLTRLHLPSQTLQCCSHEQWHNLQQDDAYFQVRKSALWHENYFTPWRHWLWSPLKN